MTPQRESLVRGLPAVLRFRTPAGDLYRRLNAVHAAVVRMRIRSLDERGAELASTLSAMPSRMRRRIELAPVVFRMLFWANLPAGSVREALERFVAVERRIDGGATIGPGAGWRWSALGDACVIDGNGGAGIPTTAWSPPPEGDLLFAPVVRRVVIDGYSPFYDRLRGSEQTYPAGDYREAVESAASALRLLEAACRPACAMLDACVTVVALFRTPGEADKPRQVSTRPLPGLVGLGNLHSKEWSPERIMDAVVHEGIHALLYKVNLCEPLYTTDRRARPRITVISPWSGKRLGVRSFTHACFVWFGLWSFWKQAGRHTESGRFFFDRARKGYEGDSFLEHVAPEARAIMQPGVVEAIRSMAAEVNASTGADRA